MRSRGYNSKECEVLLKLAFDYSNESHPYILLDNTHDVPDNARIGQGIFKNTNLYVFNKKLFKNVYLLTIFRFKRKKYILLQYIVIYIYIYYK